MAQGKIRTKTEYYATDSDTIGDVTDIGNNQLEFHNISMNEVNDEISPFGIGEIGLESIYKSSNINHWAAFRPYHTDYDDSWGWTYNTSTNELTLHTGQNESIFRLGDFAGYNHSASASRLLNESGYIGADKTYLKGDQPSTFDVAFKFEEVSPLDIFDINNMRMYLQDGTGSDFLDNIDHKAVTSISSQILTINDIDMLQNYGTKTYSVWFGYDSGLGHFITRRWKYETEVKNEFTITIKSYYTYDYTYEDITSPDTFTLTLTEDEYIDGREPTSTSTFSVSSNITLGLGDDIKIYGKANSADAWTLERTLTSIPSSITIDWTDLLGAEDIHLTEDSTYYVRAEYNTLFG